MLGQVPRYFSIILLEPTVIRTTYIVSGYLLPSSPATPPHPVLSHPVFSIQVEAEMKAQVTAQVVGDMGSEKVVEYMRALESAVTRCRQELQVR